VEEAMKNNLNCRILEVVLAFAVSSFIGTSVEVAVAVAVAQSTRIEETINPNDEAQRLDLTPAQKRSIYREVRKERSRVAPTRFVTQVGAEVPSMIALYPLPDTILDSDPITKLYQFTRVEEVLAFPAAPLCGLLPSVP
jgi:hypothetical protein